MRRAKARCVPRVAREEAFRQRRLRVDADADEIPESVGRRHRHAAEPRQQTRAIPILRGGERLEELGGNAIGLQRTGNPAMAGERAVARAAHGKITALHRHERSAKAAGHKPDGATAHGKNVCGLAHEKRGRRRRRPRCGFSCARTPRRVARGLC